MTAVPAYFMQVEAGANGTNHSITSRPFDGFIPGQTFFYGVTYEATRVTGSQTCQLRQRIEWFTAADVALTPTDHDTTIDASTTTKTYIEAKHTVPDTAAYGKMKVIITPTAAPMEHTVKVHWVRLAPTERGADITSAVTPASATANFSHSYDGVADTGQFPSNISFNLAAAGGNIGNGVTWTYTVITGTVNGFTSASGAQAMSGTGTGTIAVSSLGTNSAEVKITATYGSAVRTAVLYLHKTFAPAPSGGGGGGTTLFSDSDSSAVDGTTFVDFTGTNVATMPTGKTTLRLSMNLDIGSEPGTVAPFYTSETTVEAKFQVEISGVWTDYGVVQSAYASYTVDAEAGVMNNHGSIVYSFDVTGLTAGVSYNCRVLARESISGPRWANVSGTFIGVAP